MMKTFHSSRRGRILPLLIILASLLMFAYSAQASTPKTLHTPQTQRYVVQENDTVWSIAVKLDPQADTRKVVWQIEQANGISDQMDLIQPGQVINVPMMGGN